MPLTIATWNINSVRLRLPIVERLLDGYSPDILCLQETKCPDELFPLAAFEALGYPPYRASTARRAITASRRSRGGRSRSVERRAVLRHSRQPPSVDALRRGRDERARCTISTCRPAATSPIRTSIRNSATSSISSRRCAAFRAEWGASTASILVGDLNIAPLEHDVWSHKQLLKVVSHTPVETRRLRGDAQGTATGST